MGSGATSTFVKGGGAIFDFEGLTFKKWALFSGFEVKIQHFLIVEGLALCSIIYQILIIFMACSCV